MSRDYANGRCDACRKVAFKTRAEAKRARRMMADPGLSVYHCPEGLGFHLGHISPLVKAGLASRDDIYGQAGR